MKPSKIVSIVLGLLAAGCVIPFLTGCTTAGNQAVPSSRIKWNTQTGIADLTLPKDESIAKFGFTRNSSNDITMTLEGLNSLNNPSVIGASYSGQALLQLQVQQALLQGMQLGAQMAAQYFSGGGSALIPSLLNISSNAVPAYKTK